MTTNLSVAGYLREEELVAILPDQERLEQGPVAVLECVQEISCNPCEAACPFQAITVGQPITSLPVLNQNKCTGCGNCIAKCPGLAIFVVDSSVPGGEGTIRMPYEFLPLPKIGEMVQGLNRKGEAVVTCTVCNVFQSVGNDQTTVLTVAIPKEYVNVVRSIRQIGRDFVE